MAATLRFASAETDHEAIYRFRYEVYVEEMGCPFPGVDHRGRRLADALERPTRRLMAAFLLGVDCTADVIAVGDTKVIALRERALNEAKLAARFLWTSRASPA